MRCTHRLARCRVTGAVAALVLAAALLGFGMGAEASVSSDVSVRTRNNGGRELAVKETASADALTYDTAVGWYDGIEITLPDLAYRDCAFYLDMHSGDTSYTVDELEQLDYRCWSLFNLHNLMIPALDAHCVLYCRYRLEARDPYTYFRTEGFRTCDPSTIGTAVQPPVQPPVVPDITGVSALDASTKYFLPAGYAVEGDPTVYAPGVEVYTEDTALTFIVQQ